MTNTAMETNPKSTSKSPSEDVTPLDLVLSCAYCQAFLKDLYADQQALKDEEDNDGIFAAGPVRMWILSCGHPICSEHLEGGGGSNCALFSSLTHSPTGAPFHPHGKTPKAVCPFCEIKANDKRMRMLYWIRGIGDNEHDPRIPQKYLSSPPFPVDGNSVESEALRVGSIPSLGIRR